MNKSLFALIRAAKIFASLNDASCEELLNQCEVLELMPDEILFRQGDDSDAVYLLTEGKLVAFLVTADKQIKIIGNIGVGEIVGELGAISIQSRSLSIKATVDSRLLKIPSKVFLETCYKNPSIIFETIYPLILRSQKTIQLLSPKKNSRHVAVIAANEKVFFDTFKLEIKKNIIFNPKIAFLDEIDTENQDISSLEERIAQLEKDNTVIIYFLKSHNSPLFKLAVTYIETFYIFSDNPLNIYVDKTIFQKIQDYSQPAMRCELVLLYDAETKKPYQTKAWLTEFPFSLHHNLRQHNEKDYARLLRFIAGRPVGLVLGGGGAKGWTHIGVLKAIFENDIPIDAIGSSSVGAIAAACYATSENYEEMLSKFKTLSEVSHDLLSLKNFTWPLISLFNAKESTNTLKKIFPDIFIEDLWIPYFCVSSNLNKKKETIHSRGILWEKIRASISIPGIVPPVVIDGQLHIDGGLLNNLPVNIMRDLLGVPSKIVAVTLSQDQEDATEYCFPPSLTFKETMQLQLGFAHKEYKFPPFLDFFLNSLLLGASTREKKDMLAADLLINPNLSRFNMLGFDKKVEEKLFSLGYEKAKDKLKNWH